MIHDPASRALNWLRSMVMPSGGVRVHSGHTAAYPEVTGYIVPTWLDRGEVSLARNALKWLVSVQLPDGSFGDPDLGVPHVFDTLQVLRGLVAGHSLLPESRASLQRACDYLAGLIGNNGFGNRYNGEIPETIHLFGLCALREAAGILDQPALAEQADRAARFYVDSPELLQPGTLTHFFAYEWEGLLELGFEQHAKAILPAMLARQLENGAFPAFEGASWVCTPGVAQIAGCLLRLGNVPAALRAMRWLTSQQEGSGGWLGSYGAAATYFPKVLLPWAAKFFLDTERRLFRAREGSGSSCLVVTEELPRELAAAGLDVEFMGRYYNPHGYFRTVAAIDWGRNGGWRDGPVDNVELPHEATLEAWLTAAQSGSGDAADMSVGWQNVPQSWMRVLRTQPTDCVRAYGGAWSGWLALQVARQLGVPSLISVHNTTGISPVVMKRAGCVMVVSEAVAAECIKLGADPARVVTVPNRVDRERFTPEGPVAEGPEGDPRILCVARDVPQKNLDRLLAACQSLLPRFPNLKLVHIGSSSRDWTRWSFAHHMSSQSNQNLAPWYRWADVLALPSLHEGFGIVLIEAMACGTPCVTSNREPMAGLVTDRWDGLLCDPESEADIARALAEIAVPSTRARLAAPARAATEPFDIARVAAREAALYAWLLKPQYPLISVVLPTYKRAARIEAAVRNVLSQDYPRLELVVVNDGSPDNTAEVLEQLQQKLADPRLKVVRRENGGVARALNTGFEHATGDLLSWTSDDNEFLPGALSAMARELFMDPTLDFVFADYDLVHDDGTREITRTGPVHELDERNTVGACFLYRRTLAEKVGSYDPGHNLAEDWDWWRRARTCGNMARLPRVLYAYGDTPDSLTRQHAAAIQEAGMELTGIRNDPARAAEYRQQLVRLAATYKAGGLPLRSLGVAAQLLKQRPWGGAGWWALTRALLPMPLLKMTRKLRRLDG